MAQNKIVMAFRKRLLNRGYTKVSIYDYGRGEYYVTAYEPLSNRFISVRYSLFQLDKLLRK